jgi:hypothetical protein
MNTLTIELSDSLKENIEAFAARQGVTVSQFVAGAAGEKLAAMASFEAMRSDAAKGRREDFDRFLAAVPDVDPSDDDRCPK